MNLSVSNIAWNKDEEEIALGILNKYGIKNIEIAPTLIFDFIRSVNEKEIEDVRKKYENKQLRFVAMQSLLYGTNNYSIFDDSEKVEYIFEHLKKVIGIAKSLGIRNIVFGSPKNRLIRDLEDMKNELKAQSFFVKLADIARESEVVVCLEANPKEYNCNFLTTSLEAVNFVETINHPNLKFNLDIGTIVMNKEDLEGVFLKAKNIIGHIHISAPYIGSISEPSIDHSNIVKLIKKINYKGFVSLEMKANITSNNLIALEDNLKIFVKKYT